MDINRKTLIVSLLIISGTLILMGTSYGYFTAMATSNEQVVKSGTLELTYHTAFYIPHKSIKKERF